jgi:tetrapyrrole methylase family protein/MazG family protein
MYENKTDKDTAAFSLGHKVDKKVTDLYLDKSNNKLKEELAEVEAAAASVHSAKTVVHSAEPAAHSAAEKIVLEEELGDLLFSVVNLCRFFLVDPMLALQRPNAKFTSRFGSGEKKMKECGASMEAAHLELMDSFWNEAKESTDLFNRE